MSEHDPYDKAAELRRGDEDAAIRFVLSQPGGRALIWDLLARCSVFGASFSQGDALMTAFNEGRRHIGIQLLADVLSVEPDALARMQGEAAARAARYLVIPSPDPEGEDL